MRRKLPRPIARCSEVRALRPARAASFLPTAAAIALALAGVACSTATLDTVGPDPVTTPRPPPPAPSPSPSTSAPHLTPDPHEVEGGMGMVKPATATTVL